eukprot:14067143-Alexandrium_andersonii.AAC.1
MSVACEDTPLQVFLNLRTLCLPLPMRACKEGMQRAALVELHEAHAGVGLLKEKGGRESACSTQAV